MTRSREDRTGEAIVKSDAQWREDLTPLEYSVLREGATERAGTGMHAGTTDPGIYRCAACAAPLFDDRTKYDSGTGWPSFSEPLQDDAVALVQEGRFWGRTEVRCRSCASHLGHVFADGPAPTGPALLHELGRARAAPR